MAQPITRLNPPSLPDAAALGYAQISTVEAGRLAFVSGQVAVQRDGAPVPASLVDQTKIVGTNLKAALDAVGATPQDIVMARVYMVDLTPDRLEEMMPHLLAAFDGAQPSLTGVGVVALAAPELQLEIELVVRIPASSPCQA